ncbi:hypothetical protein S40293_10036 [Stachybotrys chartarum IBT 40293]|nr:hypothetical protein S40293_10036 [Stachybotrys chartarum IBT 40293]
MTNQKVPESTRFTYDSLSRSSQIRLLERLDPAEDGTLCFALTAHDLDASIVPYYCLSYTWGNPFAHGTPFREHFDAMESQYRTDSTVRVLINGKPLRIQKNLYDLLNTLPRNMMRDYANSSVEGTHGRIYLHIAAARGQVDTVETWLRCGVDINMLDDEGNNALHYAAGNGKPDCVPTLLRNGCRSDVKNHNGATPFDLAKADGHNEIVGMLENFSRQTESGTQGEQSVIMPANGRLYFWADAVCINQDDVVEKSTQVSMMDLIYSKASFVVAWLGPSDERSEIGIQTLNTLHNKLKTYRESEIEPFSGQGKDKYQAAGVPYISVQEWDGLASIYQRQWFRRAWIIQEAVLASTLVVYLGNNVMPWRYLGRVAEAIQHLEAKHGTHWSTSYTPPSDTGVPVILNMAEVSKWRGYKRNAHPENDKANDYLAFFTSRQLIYHFWTFMATDPRDKVFAYYGLLNLFSSNRRVSDYQLSLTSVYTMTARELIADDGNLQVLAACVGHSQRCNGLPSWVPDFSMSGINPVPTNFTADKGFEYTPPRVADPTSGGLQVKGHYVGEVSGSGNRSGNRPSEKLLFDPSWFSLVLSLRGKGGYGERPYLSSILWTTLCMNMSSESLASSATDKTEAPAALGMQFRYFVILLIHAAADGKIREKLGLEVSTKSDLIFSHSEYDPMVEDMEPVLADLDAFSEHDGGRECWLPSREEVLRYWNDFKWNLLRSTNVDSDNGPTDFHLPPGVGMENSRAVGGGYVLTESRIARRCRGFLSVYQSIYGGRHLITVNDKYLGLASLAVRPRDEVWILPGLNSPAILRPVVVELKEDNDTADLPRFEFLGSCYIHGMMDGELVSVVKSPLRDIELV